MKIKFFICLIIFLSITLNSNAKNTDLLKDIPLIESSQPCFSKSFENHETWIKDLSEKHKSLNVEVFKLKHTLQEFKNYKSSLLCYTFQYTVDNYKIDGFIIAPKNSKKLPVIIFNRGGSSTFGNMTFSSLYTNLFYLANNGFAVIGSQYRGGMGKSEKIGGKDEWGGRDVNDVNALFEIVDNISFLNNKRIGMYGVSRGSVNTFLVAKNTKRVKAIVSASGVYDLIKELEFRPNMEKIYKKYIPKYKEMKTEELEKRSVIKWAHKLDMNAPILLLHGSYDNRASATGAIDFAKTLQKLFFRYSLIIYEAENHSFSSHIKESQQEIIKWFEQYL